METMEAIGKSGPERRMQLISLELTNFKGLPHLRLDFDGRSGRITGENGAGKTSVYDGLTWLLYGKDSLGRERFDLKPLGPDGNPKDRRAVTSVEGLLSLGDRRVRLRRSYYEKWAKRRGGEVFEGNTSDYFVDGVAMSRTDYDRTVGSLLGEDRFRLLTNAAYFPGTLGWRERRAILFEMADIRSDRELMEETERFRPLKEAMGTASLESFRRQLEALRRSLTGQRAELPHRINENEVRLESLEGSWEADPEGRLEELKQRKKTLEAEILVAGKEESLQRLSQEEAALAAAMDALEAEQKSFAQEARRQETRWEAAVATARERVSRAKERREAIALRLEELEEAARQAPKAPEEERPERCPLCGGALKGEARRRWEAQTREAEEKRREEERQRQWQRQSLEEKRSQAERALEREQEGLRQAEQGLREQQRRPGEMPLYRARREDLQEQQRRKREERSRLSREGEGLSRDKRREKEEVEQAMEALRKELARRALAEDCRSRIRQLNREAEQTEQAILRTENMLELCREFLSWKASKAEQRVNGLFSMASFRLYRQLVGGGLEDCCDATYQGVPYESLNSGAKMNLGLDIISALSKSFGQWVPLFVDNAESVTHLLSLDTQVIRLEVGAGPLELELDGEGQTALRQGLQGI